MSIYEHSRWAIFNQRQHPYRHDVSEFFYSNPRLTGVSDVAGALNYISAVLYPNYIGSFATKADLPLTSNENDYAIVNDDGDGKAAGYVYVTIDGAAAWYKRFDVDWSVDGIMAEAINRTQYIYVQKYGIDDKDSTGTTITGTLAGQQIYGGASTNTNLTFNANSKDNTGYVQTVNHFRPTTDNAVDLGTSALKFRSGYLGTSLTVGTVSISGGHLSDSSGGLDFGSTNITTTGTITGNIVIGSSLSVGTLSLSSGSITDSGGTISFGTDALSTSGGITGGTLVGTTSAKGGNLLLSGNILSSTNTNGDIHINPNGTGAVVVAASLSATGALSGSAVLGGNLEITGNTLSSTDTNGNINISPNGTGTVAVSATTAVTGNLSATGTLKGGNLQFSTNTLQSTDTNGNIIVAPNGTGKIQVNALVQPGTDASYALGTTALRYTNLYLSGSLGDGTNTISIATLLSFRAALTGASSGMTLFYDGSQWNPSIPDTEITHSTLTGLTTGDAGHTQFVMLAGRSGGQTIQGDTGAAGNLYLESTSNASKGSVFTKDNLSPNTNASYSVSWSGTDLGDSSHYYRDIYSKGVHKGLRLENVTSGTLPTSSAQNVGRLVFATDTNKIYVDTGTSFIVAGIGKYLSDTSWDGSTTSKTIDVSASIVDARNAIWAIHDNSNNYERIYAKITAISATQVTVAVNPALPAGSYRLIGIE